jgi:hypothetical protein
MHETINHNQQDQGEEGDKSKQCLIDNLMETLVQN